MSRKLMYYILVLIGAWFLWDYTRHRHTELWWMKRFMSYPGISPGSVLVRADVKTSGSVLVSGSVKMAYEHLKRLRKYHPERIRPALPYEKQTNIPVDTLWFTDIPRSEWWVDMNGGAPIDKKNLTWMQKLFVARMEDLAAWDKEKAAIRKKYEEGNA